MKLDYSKLDVCIICQNIDDYNKIKWKVKLDNILAEHMVETRWVFWIFIWKNWSEWYWDIKGVPSSLKVSAENFIRRWL